MRRLAPLLAVLAVSATGGCREDPTSEPPAAAEASPKGRCEDRISALRRELDALAQSAASRASIGPATLVAGDGEDVAPTAVVTVSEAGLAFGGRPIGGWEPSGSDALVGALETALRDREGDRLALAIDRETTWTHLVDAVDLLRMKGITTVTVLFEGPEDRRIQGSALAKELSELPTETQLWHVMERIDALTASCAPAREVFTQFAEAGGGGVEEVMAAALPEALTKCECAADVEALGETTLVLLLPSHRLVGTSVTLGGPDAPPLRQPGDARWADVAKGIAATGSGRRWESAGSVAEPEPEPEPEPPPPPKRKPD